MLRGASTPGWRGTASWGPSWLSERHRIPQAGGAFMPRFENVACTRCGCVCDDLCLTVDGGRIVRAERACVLAEPWLLHQDSRQPPVALIDGRAVPLDEGLDRAAAILRLGQRGAGLRSVASARRRTGRRSAPASRRSRPVTPLTIHRHVSSGEKPFGGNPLQRPRPGRGGSRGETGNPLADQRDHPVVPRHRPQPSHRGDGIRHGIPEARFGSHRAAISSAVQRFSVFRGFFACFSHAAAIGIYYPFPFPLSGWSSESHDAARATRLVDRGGAGRGGRPVFVRAPRLRRLRHASAVARRGGCRLASGPRPDDSRRMPCPCHGPNCHTVPADSAPSPVPLAPLTARIRRGCRLPSRRRPPPGPAWSASDPPRTPLFSPASRTPPALIPRIRSH